LNDGDQRPGADARNIVWIASYPKSGNTWLRFLICNLVFGPTDSAESLQTLAPDLHELASLPPPTGQMVLLKTHFPSLRLPVARTVAALYIVRHPLDVMLSNFHYAQRSGRPGFNTPDALDRYIDSYIAAGGDSRWSALGMGTWQENVTSWVAAQSPFPIFWLRYEDLQKDAEAMAHSLCRFLGIERGPGEIADAVRGASFERMSQIEEADIRARRVGIFYKPYLDAPIRDGLRFMRAGKGGDAGLSLRPEQLIRFRGVFGSLGLKLGYG
jgi:Sulfotransferase domain